MQDIYIGFESGFVKIRNMHRQLQLCFRFNGETGELLDVSRVLPDSYAGTLLHMQRRVFYAYTRTYLPRKVMTPDERKEAHKQSVQLHRKRKREKKRILQLVKERGGSNV